MRTRCIGYTWLGVQNAENACAAREAAHKPVHHIAEGANRCTQQEHILCHGDQCAQAQAMINYYNTAYPYDEDGDNIEDQDHQRLIPGREAHSTQVEVAYLVVLGLKLGNLKIIARKGFDHAHTTQALLHHSTQGTCFV